MKKYLALAMFLVLAVVLVSPFSVSAKTKAGTKSGSFFYFFDTAFEKAGLFFTFNPEKKAKKALENAEERLAEAEELASESKPEAVAEAMENYKKNIEVLEKVLEKVPEEAKEAIEKAIEASKERQEETMKETTELEKEVLEIKPDVEETENELKEEENEGKAKIKDDKKNEQKKEIEKLKKEVEALKQKTSQVKIIEKVVEKKESSSNQTKQKENIITLPNGAVVEMDEDGNVVRTIKEASQQTYIAPIDNKKSNYEIEATTGDKSVVKKQGNSQAESLSSSSVPINPEVKKQVRVISGCTAVFPGTYCDVEVYYLENGERKNALSVIVSSNDDGIFIESSYPYHQCIGAETANSDGFQRKGNPLTCPTRPSPLDGMPEALFTYLPSATGTRLITATINGVTGYGQSQGQISECSGKVRGECGP